MTNGLWVDQAHMRGTKAAIFAPLLFGRSYRCFVKAGLGRKHLVAPFGKIRHKRPYLGRKVTSTRVDDVDRQWRKLIIGQYRP
jgi:hypothetical protein